MIHKQGQLPTVLEDLTELGNEKHRLKVRIVEYLHPLIGTSLPFLDIRRYFVNKQNKDGTLWTGYGSGISFSLKDLIRLRHELPAWIELLEKHQRNREKNVRDKRS